MSVCVNECTYICLASYIRIALQSGVAGSISNGGDYGIHC